MNMLLVDDDTTFCQLFIASMMRQGIHCTAVHHANSARELIATTPFSHAVLDLNLGGGDSGLTLLRHLHALQPECRAIMLTGFASIATTVEAMRCGAIGYLPKPARVQEILAAFSNSETASDDPHPMQIPSPKRMEWEYIQRTLLQNGGNISATARKLGMHRRTLQRKLNTHPPVK